jgi:hypothetical protein
MFTTPVNMPIQHLETSYCRHKISKPILYLKAALHIMESKHCFRCSAYRQYEYQTFFSLTVSGSSLSPGLLGTLLNLACSRSAHSLDIPVQHWSEQGAISINDQIQTALSLHCRATCMAASGDIGHPRGCLRALATYPVLPFIRS